jgi:copper homeostasis protein
MSVTFHRAFDLCIDPLKGLKDVISTGSDRLLTSGQANSAMDGADLIATLVKLSAGRISVMPGGGITEDNIASVVRSTGAMEFHLTGRRLTESDMEFRRKGVEMGGSLILDEYKRKVADRLTISKIAEILKMI